MKHIPYLLILTLVFLVGLAGCNLPGGNANSSSTPTPLSVATASPTSTPTAVPTLMPTTATTPDTSGVSQVIMKYYAALKAQNYSLAYTYLDTNATDANGHRVTLKSFEQMAQTMESEGGPVVSFSVAVFLPTAVMSVTRASLVYHAHLQVKQEGQTWKIISLDRT